MLFCPEQGGWNRGVWFEERWVDSLTLTVVLEPAFWDDVPPDPPEEMLRIVVSDKER